MHAAKRCVPGQLLTAFPLRSLFVHLLFTVVACFVGRSIYRPPHTGKTTGEDTEMTALRAELNSQQDASVTEWECGTLLLHREDAGFYVLLDPENRDFVPLGFLAEHGIDAGWTCEQFTVGQVTVTELRR